LVFFDEIVEAISIFFIMARICDNQKIHSAIIRHPLTTVIVKGIARQQRLFLIEIIVGARAQRIPSDGFDDHRDSLLAPILRKLQAYLDGQQVDFSAIPIELHGVSSFQSAVLHAARRIPYGSTRSYSLLAKEAGFANAIRATASVMRNNPLPLLIPCHRVIRKSGSIGAYCGDAHGEDAALKQSLLQLERA
jgi:O-6-methylguanine DNA methyltransferase